MGYNLPFGLLHYPEKQIHLIHNKNKKTLYDNFEYINYKDALKIYSSIDDEDLNYLKILNLIS